MLRGLIARVLLLVLTVALGLPVVVVALLAPRWADLSMRLGRLWSRGMMAAVGARVAFEGLEHISQDEPRIYVANHQSSIDIWALIVALPTSARFVAKQELFRIPVFGWVLSAAGFVAIDRGNRSEAIRGLAAAAQRVRAGRSVVLFPEGTRSPDGRLRPFKKGAFHLALRARVPVVPVAIAGSWAVMAPHRLRVHPGPVRVVFCPPIDPGPFKAGDHDDLRRRVREAIAERLAVLEPSAVDRAPADGPAGDRPLSRPAR